jgi:SAM-dependent methyltransferase
MTTAVSRDFAAAAATWNDPNETLESVNARIHDGVPLEKLEERADSYIRGIFGHFPYVRLPNRPVCLEIGSGTGYIMEALNRELLRRLNPPGSITGLDIAENMLARASRRLSGQGPFRFLHYDGVNVPAPGESFDFIYSVAALQHVPKPYVYNLFFEVHRLLRPAGFAAFTLLSFNYLPTQERFIRWRDEINRQIKLEVGHWHHYYSKDELDNVLKAGTGFPYVDVRDEDGIWVCAHKSPLPLPGDFDGERYLELNPDVRGMDPAEHWIQYGYREGRRWR